MKDVIFDSSFLMAIAETPTDWEDGLLGSLGGFEPVMLKAVSEELDRLSSGKGKRAKAARVAIEISKRFKPLKGGPGKADEEIISAALGSAAAVATMDRELIRALTKLRVETVTLRSGRVALVSR